MFDGTSPSLANLARGFWVAPLLAPRTEKQLQGLLTAAISGETFASPSIDAVLAAIAPREFRRRWVSFSEAVESIACGHVV